MRGTDLHYQPRPGPDEPADIPHADRPCRLPHHRHLEGLGHLPELGRIRVPTPVFGGEFDECVPVHLADIAARIPDSEHITQSGAAHMGYLEREPLRSDYISTIADYLTRTESRRRAT
ncbi:hypothetical protein [Spongiactinospora gelatinilytica]|uniref:hypothetical protein n=1 Tax=Spongiactinospora gelatinilytica TaxID=2666298 RepID=UPI0013145B78|nr:hypothetical protein [Spongiactinospora gelatinilytica]